MVATAVDQLRPLQSPRGRRDREEKEEGDQKSLRIEGRKKHEKETLKQR